MARLIAWLEHLGWLVQQRREIDRRAALAKHMRAPDLEGLEPFASWLLVHGGDLPLGTPTPVLSLVREVHALSDDGRRLFDALRFSAWLFGGPHTEEHPDVLNFPAMVDARTHLAVLEPAHRAVFESLYGRTRLWRELHGQHIDETVHACPFCQRVFYLGWPS